MAKQRRDELAAYTFARKRTVAAFLAPSPGGSEEGAPRPVRTVMPSLAVGVVLVIGFIAWGVIKPTAPKGWDTPGEYIIVDSDSTTRYVVLDPNPKDGKVEKVLHPVLNYASAKLLLDKGKGTVLEVPGKEIDKSGIRHGATIGIPYAPDRLPSKEDAEKAKTWAVCERPAPGSEGAIDRAVFVFDSDDAKSLGNSGKVDPLEALYVKDTKTSREYLVDGKGNRFRMGGESGLGEVAMEQLRSAVIGSSTTAKSQPVSQEWLSTLNEGEDIDFPTVPSAGAATSVQGLSGVSTVGQVLRARDAQTDEFYVVLKDEVASITPFVAALLVAHDGSAPVKASTPDIIKANGGPAESFYKDNGWPQVVPKQANSQATASGDARLASCSVYTGEFGTDKKPQLAAWAGTNYPKKVISDSLSAYVSSGSGLLFQEVAGTAAGGGAQYLLTDTGLRYSLPSTNDSEAENGDSGSSSDSSDGGSSQNGPSETDKARTRLGYEDLSSPSIVPQTWATFIPKGPTLDTTSATQPQSQ
ncbi:type VII secretion protein EccB [Streptomyces chartreusis]|uniref:type VII secretion protein EccB n=1 Tax=Streptomyces chartreusis TaxID=1969 RepID=UPI00123D0E7C|nr:type VII secretion protein EccB [Streptomyces chartreusis]QEV67343.1 type VII secretion protein EccB [Streptomyces chartreusis]GGX51847.1 type VII secretion protein EccB [Streptomyces chartreusis]